MKKFLLFLAALTAFAACDDDPIDYSTWSEEELLATPGGVDYLIKTAGQIDYAYIEEQLKTMVFSPYYFFVYDERDGWTEPRDWVGITFNYYFIIGNAARGCYYVGESGCLYKTPTGEITSSYYKNYTFTGDRLTAILDSFEKGSKVKAQLGNTLIVENFDSYGRRWLYLVSLDDLRESLLELYPYSFDELTPYHPGAPSMN